MARAAQEAKRKELEQMKDEALKSMEDFEKISQNQDQKKMSLKEQIEMMEKK